MKKKSHKSHFLFLKSFLSNPFETGSVIPSSKKLCKTMASFVACDNADGLIVELGAGTGVITDALIHHGVPLDKFIAMDMSEDLVQFLAKKYPHVNFLHGDASELSKALGNHLNGEGISTIISSLPLKSLPKNLTEKIMDEMYSLLNKNGTIIQYTYDLRRGRSVLNRKFTHTKTKIIWKNFPPARVDVFEKKQ